MNTLRKQLRVLGCPFAEKLSSLDSIVNQALLICWLEDRKISELEINERSKLQPDNPSWSVDVKKYLIQLGCPYDWQPQESDNAIPEENTEALMWLVSVAINLDYEDFQETMDVEDSPAPVVTNSSPMETSTPGGESNTVLIKKCEELGAALELPRKANETTIDYLRRLSLKVKLSMTLLNQSAISHPLDSFPLGFSTGDKLTDEVAVVLRMLYLSDFRELQNEANDLIVLGQEYTANPRLNSSLGKVGR